VPPYLLMLDLPLQFLIIAVHGVLVVLASIAFMRAVPRWLKRDPESITPTSTSYNGVGMVFALLLAFHVSGIWQRQDEAQRAFVQMNDALHHMTALTGEKMYDLPPLRQALKRFVVLMRDKEWTQSHNREAHPEVEAALMDLRWQVAHLAKVPSYEQVHFSRLLDEIGSARQHTLWVAAHQRDRVAWSVILLLGYLSHLVIAAMHFDKPAAGTTAIVIFGVATCIAYGAMIAREDPYRSSGLLNPSVLSVP
jgi:hypothetical protein